MAKKKTKFQQECERFVRPIGSEAFIIASGNGPHIQIGMEGNGRELMELFSSVVENALDLMGPLAMLTIMKAVEGNLHEKRRKRPLRKAVKVKTR